MYIILLRFETGKFNVDFVFIAARVVILAVLSVVKSADYAGSRSAKAHLLATVPSTLLVSFL